MQGNTRLHTFWLFSIEEPRARCRRRMLNGLAVLPRVAHRRLIASYTSQEGSPKQARCLIRKHKIKNKVKEKETAAICAAGGADITPSVTEHGGEAERMRAMRAR